MLKQKQIFIAISLVVLTLVVSILVVQSQKPLSAELPHDMPVVYVYPTQAFGAKGTTFTVSVKIFNLTNNFYQTDTLWKPGEPLGEPGAFFNYSLGNLYGFDIVFSWDPEILEYEDRLVMIPVEDYPEGILHAPILNIKDTVDYTNGKYYLSQSSWLPVESFNCPNDNSTIFTMTFKVKEEKASPIILESIELMLDPALEGVPDIIPHAAIDGEFCRARTIRVLSLDVGAPVETQWLNPVISGEDVSIRLYVFNEGETSNHFNLTLYSDDIPLVWWRGEGLNRIESKAYYYILKTSNLAWGLHRVTAKISVYHYETLIEDSLTENFTIINEPSLNIIKAPSEIQKNETMTISAESNYHQDANSFILEYKWHLYEPKAGTPTYEFEGSSITHTFTKNGTWTALLTVKDNWNITFDPLRQSTSIYQMETTINVGIGGPPTPFLTQERATMIIIFVLVAIACVFGYLLGKRFS
jgi:hypothetical protein